jgi:hypothetical protein
LGWGTAPSAEYPTGYAPILVGWSRPGESDLLFGDENIATTAPLYIEHSLSKERIMVGGVIAIDADKNPFLPAGFAGATMGGVILHEIGHILNLDHIDDVEQMMYPELTDNSSRFGWGDLAGLREVGASKGCISVPPAPWDAQQQEQAA